MFDVAPGWIISSLLLLFHPASTAVAPVLTWASQPVLPGESVLLVGGGFDNGTRIELTDSQGASLTVDPIPGQVSADGTSLKFILPDRLAAWQVRAIGKGTGKSQQLPMNYPEVQWAFGDGAQHATVGGYVRLFGKCLSFPQQDLEELKARERRLEAEVARWLDEEEEEEATAAASAAAALRRLAGLRGALRGAEAAALPTLRLERKGKQPGQAPVLHDIVATNASGSAAFFALPPEVQVGEYFVSVANSLAPDHFVGMDVFIDPTHPRVSTIEIIAPNPYPELTVSVKDIDPAIGNVPKGGATAWVDSMPAFMKAIDQVKQAGGGTVYFPRGQYFLNSTEGVTVPWNVRIKGEGRELVALYWAWANTTSAPQAYFRSPGTIGIDEGPQGSGRWGLEDLTVYIVGYHNFVIFLNNHTDGFSLLRTRLFANSYFAGNGPYTPQKTAGKWSNFTLEQAGGAMIGLQNCRNFQIRDNDLFSTWVMITSFVKFACRKEWKSSCHGAQWGLISNNKIWNNGGSHWMNQWQQVVFERNDILGVSPIAMGNPIGSGPGGGYAQNIYHAHNHIKFVHGNDRELITTDDAGGAYFGTVAKFAQTEVTLAYDARSCGSWEWGGWEGAALVVLNGTGVGQWRRITVPGIGPEGYNEGNRTWRIDRPFSVEPGSDSLVQILPFRGNFIFDGDHFEDGGNVQIYGQALDVMVINCLGERMAGFVAWGQWRGCSEFQFCQTPGMLQGEHGNGVMPNVRVQFINNTIIEGNKVVRFYAQTSGGSYSFGLEKFNHGATFSVSGDGVPEYPEMKQSYFIIYRRNVVRSNGGFHVVGKGGHGIRDVIIEGNVVRNTDASVALQLSSGPENVLLRLNDFPNASSLRDEEAALARAPAPEPLQLLV